MQPSVQQHHMPAASTMTAGFSKVLVMVRLAPRQLFLAGPRWHATTLTSCCMLFNRRCMLMDQQAIMDWSDTLLHL
jgi:hypothetical protein